jgi:hypothetical protein
MRCGGVVRSLKDNIINFNTMNEYYKLFGKLNKIEKKLNIIAEHFGIEFEEPKKKKIPVIEEEKEKSKEDILKLYPKAEEVLEEKIPIKIKK